MFRLFFYLTFAFIIGLSIYAYVDSQRTFEAKFKNIDGLPQGASVTAFGTEIGKVIKTRPTHDGVIVTVKITNKRFPKPEAGSQLTITSLRPNQGRVLEIILPEEDTNGTKAWIIQEPITTDTWLHASLELVNRLEMFSHSIIKQLTPENFQNARNAFARASESLSQTAAHLAENEKKLIELKNRFANKTNEANELLIRLQKPINTLNKIIANKDFPEALKGDLGNFSQDLINISNNVLKPEFFNDVMAFNVNILDNLNKKIEGINQKNLSENIKTPLKKARDFTVKSSEQTRK